jgi:hypothetical protein
MGAAGSDHRRGVGAEGGGDVLERDGSDQSPRKLLERLRPHHPQQLLSRVHSLAPDVGLVAWGDGGGSGCTRAPLTSPDVSHAQHPCGPPVFTV